MTSLDDLDRWNNVADAYAQVMGQPQDSFYRRTQPALDAAIPDPAGSRILDLGCGHGWLAATYAARGATVVGIDGSTALIDKARQLPTTVQWIVHDLDAGLPADLGPFDAAIAHMVLMDLPHLEPVLADLARALAPGGVFVASLLHPAFYNQPVHGHAGGWHRRVTDYLTQERWWVDSFGGHWHYHRPLEFYINALAAAGFVVTNITEPPSLPHDLAEQDDWDNYQQWFARIPTMMTITAHTPSYSLIG